MKFKIKLMSISLSVCTIFVASAFLNAQDSTSTSIRQYHLRSAPKYLKIEDVARMLKLLDFYCKYQSYWSKGYANPLGKGIANKYTMLAHNKVIFDETTELYWQKSESVEKFGASMKQYEYIDSLNYVHYGGFDDWRLPTLEEAMSLMEPEKNERGFFIDSLFDINHEGQIWTADATQWVVSYEDGYCLIFWTAHILAIRSNKD